MGRLPFIAVLWLVASCSSAAGSDEPPLESDVVADQPTVVVPPIDDPTTPDPRLMDLPQSFITPVVHEIARIAGISPTAVVVVSAQSVTFPNSGLGCPEPGFAYTQVQVDGYRVVAAALGTTYDYRGTGVGVFRRCR